jgi:hypothetical protein
MSQLKRVWTLTGLKPEKRQTATSAIARPWRLQISWVVLRKEVILKATLRGKEEKENLRGLANGNVISSILDRSICSSGRGDLVGSSRR